VHPAWAKHLRLGLLDGEVDEHVKAAVRSDLPADGVKVASTNAVMIKKMFSIYCGISLAAAVDVD
jgi:hypothetical protein